MGGLGDGVSASMTGVGEGVTGCLAGCGWEQDTDSIDGNTIDARSRRPVSTRHREVFGTSYVSFKLD